MAIDWQSFGYVLAGELGFALLVAWITHYLDAKRLEGQTYGLVVLGVAGVVAIAGPSIGWEAVAILGMCFAVAALPMGVEYYSRVTADTVAAQLAMEEMINGNSGTGREARVSGCPHGCAAGVDGIAASVEEGADGKPERGGAGVDRQRGV